MKTGRIGLEAAKEVLKHKRASGQSKRRINDLIETVFQEPLGTKIRIYDSSYPNGTATYLRYFYEEFLKTFRTLYPNVELKGDRLNQEVERITPTMKELAIYEVVVHYLNEDKKKETKAETEDVEISNLRQIVDILIK